MLSCMKVLRVMVSSLKVSVKLYATPLKYLFDTSLKPFPKLVGVIFCNAIREDNF